MISIPVTLNGEALVISSLDYHVDAVASDLHLRNNMESSTCQLVIDLKLEW
jgi:hypothetical protein